MKKIISLLCISAVMFSCQKTNNPPTTSSGGGSSPQNTTISNGFPSSGTGSINGVLYSQKLTITNYSVTQYAAGAGFSAIAKPFSFISFYSGVIGYNPAGVVKINSTILKDSIRGSTNYYTDTTSNSVYSSVSWNVGGNPSFSTFTTSVPRGYPAIVNTGYLPAAFSKSVPLTLTFGTANYTNTDSLFVVITDNISSAFIYKYLPGNSTSVTFPVAQLSGFSVGTQGAITIFAKNYSNLTNAGKNYIFVLENTLAQWVTINP